MPRLALIQFLDGHDGPVDPGYGVPGFGGHPDNSLPGGGHIDNSLPPGAVNLPVFPFDPTIDNSLPTPPGGHIDNGLPLPGKKYVIKYLKCKGLILVPDNSLPEHPEPK